MKEFDLSGTIGGILGEAVATEEKIAMHILASSPVELSLPRHLFKNAELDKAFEQESGISIEIMDISGKYNLAESGEITSIEITSNPYIIFNYSQGVIFEEDRKYLLDLGLLERVLYPRDGSIGEYIAEFIEELREGEYE